MWVLFFLHVCFFKEIALALLFAILPNFSTSFMRVQNLARGYGKNTLIFLYNTWRYYIETTPDTRADTPRYTPGRSYHVA